MSSTTPARRARSRWWGPPRPTCARAACRSRARWPRRSWGALRATTCTSPRRAGGRRTGSSGWGPEELRRMAELLLFHHAQGRTAGCLSFADELRAAGHVVHAPDLYDGKTFAGLTDGVGYAEQVGFDTILDRGRLPPDGLPDDIAYAGFSLGSLPAQILAQTRPGPPAALLL